MFDNTITLAALFGADRVLTRVNQDKFASTYRYRSSDVGVDINIRHTTRLDKGATVNTDRHNVEIILTHYVVSGTVTTPHIFKMYAVFENEANADVNTVSYLGNILATQFLDSGHIGRLVSWES